MRQCGRCRCGAKHRWRRPHSRLKAWTPNAFRPVRSLALQGEVWLGCGAGLLGLISRPTGGRRKARPRGRRSRRSGRGRSSATCRRRGRPWGEARRGGRCRPCGGRGGRRLPLLWQRRELPQHRHGHAQGHARSPPRAAAMTPHVGMGLHMLLSREVLQPLSLPGAILTSEQQRDRYCEGNRRNRIQRYKARQRSSRRGRACQARSYRGIWRKCT